MNLHSAKLPSQRLIKIYKATFKKNLKIYLLWSAITATIITNILFSNRRSHYNVNITEVETTQRMKWSKSYLEKLEQCKHIAVIDKYGNVPVKCMNICIKVSCLHSAIPSLSTKEVEYSRVLAEVGIRQDGNKREKQKVEKRGREMTGGPKFLVCSRIRVNLYVTVHKRNFTEGGILWF